MNDRVPLKPGRVKVAPENGNPEFFATITRADEPTQEGTPLNKATLLKDSTAIKYGLTQDATPDDVLNNMVTPAVAEQFGLSTESVPSDVFSILSNALILSDGDSIVKPNGSIVPMTRIETGSYTGTGTSGSNNRTAIVFSGTPMLGIVAHKSSENNNIGFWVYGSNMFVYSAPGPGRSGNVLMYCNTATLSSTTLDWYSTAGQPQLNSRGVKYYYAFVTKG